VDYAEEQDMADGKLNELNAVEVDALLRSGKALLIDVREPGEYGAERIPGALLLPLSTFNPAHLPRGGDKQLIFHCGGGGRSAKAAGLLFATGIAETSHLAGGIRAWKAAGLPVIALDPATGKPMEVRSA
jgi:rhodanese-related sulfurtransferase